MLAMKSNEFQCLVSLDKGGFLVPHCVVLPQKWQYFVIVCNSILISHAAFIPMFRKISYFCFHFLAYNSDQYKAT